MSRLAAAEQALSAARAIAVAYRNGRTRDDAAWHCANAIVDAIDGAADRGAEPAPEPVAWAIESNGAYVNLYLNPECAYTHRNGTTVVPLWRHPAPLAAAPGAETTTDEDAQQDGADA